MSLKIDGLKWEPLILSPYLEDGLLEEGRECIHCMIVNDRELEVMIWSYRIFQLDESIPFENM